MKAPLLPLLLAAATLAISTPALARSCLPYGPLKVTLSGTLERKTFPGAPDFEDVKQGDQPETGYYLRLPSAMCVAASAKTQQQAHDGVGELQLVLDQAQYAHLASEIGQTVRLTGTLLEASTGHHHAPVLLKVDAIDGD